MRDKDMHVAIEVASSLCEKLSLSFVDSVQCYLHTFRDEMGITHVLGPKSHGIHVISNCQCSEIR
jgi:hypothetical protein